jgi:hypothetical protein
MVFRINLCCQRDIEVMPLRVTGQQNGAASLLRKATVAEKSNLIPVLRNQGLDAELMKYVTGLIAQT